MIVCGTPINAQCPYKHSIGGIVGNFSAFSYKTFVSEHFSMNFDVGYKLTPTFYSCTYSCTSKDEKSSWISNSIYRNTFCSVELNPNFMYEGNFTKGLYGFAGGGISLGYCWNTLNGLCVIGPGPHVYGQGNLQETKLDAFNAGEIGINAIFGLEYAFNFPLALSIDFRPGYGMIFWKRYYDLVAVPSNEPIKQKSSMQYHFFDWGLCFGIRYLFH